MVWAGLEEPVGSATATEKYGVLEGTVVTVDPN